MSILWKIYFIIAVAEALLAVTGLFYDPGYHIFTQIVMAVIFLIVLNQKSVCPFTNEPITLFLHFMF